MSNKDIVEDFLEVDQPIPGQNYACLSFISPENVLKNKDIFLIHAFLKTFGKNYGLTEEECQDKYKDFLYMNQEKLEKEFYEKNNFQTTMRGLKVRGVYDTEKEANVRAKALQRRDPNFNVYVAQVGYWLPWDPNPHSVDRQEYAEKELNTLVSEYRANQEKKDEHFRENIDYVKEQAAKQAEASKKSKQDELLTSTQVNSDETTTDDMPPLIETATENTNTSSSTSDETEELAKQLENADPWLSRQTSKTEDNESA
jgi:hypothetical protein